MSSNEFPALGDVKSFPMKRMKFKKSTFKNKKVTFSVSSSSGFRHREPPKWWETNRQLPAGFDPTKMPPRRTFLEDYDPSVPPPTLLKSADHFTGKNYVAA